MNKKIYLLLQLKRYLKKYPSIICITLATFIVTGIFAGFAFNNTLSGEDKQKIKIGITGDTGESYLNVGIYALKNIDSSRFSVDFEEMTIEEAKKALESSKISGFADIPENFIRSILRGKNTPAIYYIREGAVNFGSVIIKEITQTVSDLVTGSQKAIYSMQDVAYLYDKTENLGTKNKKLNLMYIDMILNRINIFSIEQTGISDNLSLGGYYICSIITIMLMLWAISCSGILSSKNESLLRLLRTRSIGCTRQVMCEYIAYLVITMITFMLTTVVVSFIPPDIISIIPELEHADTTDFILFTLKIIPAIMMLTAMHTAIFEVVRNTVGAIFMVFIITVVMGYICGCFYPNFFFSQSVQNMGLILPVGAGFLYIRQVMNKSMELHSFMLCAMYFLIFTGISISVRKFRTAGEKI